MSSLCFCPCAKFCSWQVRAPLPIPKASPCPSTSTQDFHGHTLDEISCTHLKPLVLVNMNYNNGSP